MLYHAMAINHVLYNSQGMQSHTSVLSNLVNFLKSGFLLQLIHLAWLVLPGVSQTPVITISKLVITKNSQFKTGISE